MKIISTDYKKGQIIEAIVTGIESYGFFVQIDDEYKGLVHISEVSNSFVRNIEDYVSVGQKIKAQIIDIDLQTHHLKLSIKNLNYNDNPDFKESEGFLNLKNKLNYWINNYEDVQ